MFLLLLLLLPPYGIHSAKKSAEETTGNVPSHFAKHQATDNSCSKAQHVGKRTLHWPGARWKFPSECATYGGIRVGNDVIEQERPVEIEAL